MTNRFKVWLGPWANVWSCRGYKVEAEYVLCDSRSDAEQVVAWTFELDLAEFHTDDSSFYYFDQRSADADADGSGAVAVIVQYRHKNQEQA